MKLIGFFKNKQNLIYLFLFFSLITFLSYFRVLNGDFIWDDNVYILQNPIFQQTHPLLKIWFSHEIQDYWPVSYSLFFLEFKLFGLNALGYHIVNLLIHTLTCLALFKILGKLKVPFAFLISLMFCVHPMNVESVAWIFQTKTTLAYLFALIASSYYINNINKPKARHYLLALAFLLLANLTKTSVITWPAVLLLLDYYLNDFKINRKMFFRIAPFLLISVVFGLVSLLWYNDGNPVALSEIVRDDDFITRLISSGQVLFFYIYKIIFPISLNFSYEKWGFRTNDFSNWIPTLLSLGTVGFLFLKREKAKGISLGLGYFLITLFPVLGFFNIYYMRYAEVADHYVYLAMVGLIALVILGINKLTNKTITLVIGTITVTLLMGLTYIRSNVFTSEKSVWQDVVEKNPTSWLAYNKLGIIEQTDKNYSEALDYYKLALGIKETAQGHYNIASMMEMKGDYANSLAEYEMAQKANPNSGKVENKVGIVLGKMGKDEEAITHLKKAITLQGGDDAAYTLSLYYQQKKNWKESLKYIELLTKRYPDNEIFEAKKKQIEKNSITDSSK
jgi:tetratricopeptide (TPR) repeat protein